MHFEDALKYFAFEENNIDMLLTRNIKDYVEHDIKVLTHKKFLESY
ncbi:MAG: twitching motility protein PilT [Treponema sp.]|nr:MAG: twitching motility protein PilT [Treponema sp.]